MSSVAKAEMVVRFTHVRDVAPELRAFAWRFLQHSGEWRNLQSYRDAAGNTWSFEDDIEVGEAVVSDRGAPVRFVRIDLGPWGGTAGQQTYMLERRNGGWFRLMDDVVADVRILDQTDDGYHRLCFARALHYWDGAEYVTAHSGHEYVTTLSGAPYKPPKFSNDNELIGQVVCDDGWRLYRRNADGTEEVLADPLLDSRKTPEENNRALANFKRPSPDERRILEDIYYHRRPPKP